MQFVDRAAGSGEWRGLTDLPLQQDAQSNSDGLLDLVLANLPTFKHDPVSRHSNLVVKARAEGLGKG